eukprot:2647744-Prymnesium_polylepis.1
MRRSNLNVSRPAMRRASAHAHDPRTPLCAGRRLTPQTARSRALADTGRTERSQSHSARTRRRVACGQGTGSDTATSAAA